MNAPDAIVLLTRARLIDPRVGLNREDGLDKADTWAAYLGDITLDEALRALQGHQTSSERPVMPVHIIDRVRAERARAQRPIERARQQRELVEYQERRPFTDEERAEADRVYHEALEQARAARSAR